MGSEDDEVNPTDVKQSDPPKPDLAEASDIRQLALSCAMLMKLHEIHSARFNRQLVFNIIITITALIGIFI